ncbi:uncharacterized protein LOC109806986 [Cajanus cajan]|uniref:uncharacterized protein LOC109806986 n=1 Tax=Cajanus cajan TaxID=3821 RepID=UPI00098D76F6|nr:uncharacterized protein LOC109806986 [Cajanus cajan]
MGRSSIVCYETSSNLERAILTPEQIMAGRNDRAIADALQALAQAMSNNDRAGGAPNWLEQFQRNHPPTFKEEYDPDAAMNWLTKIEKIFNKEVEFLELKQGNNTVAEYAAKFDSLVRYCSHYHGEGGERAKCIKFVNVLRPEGKTAINYQEIYHFATLVNKCRIFDRDNRACAAFYKGAGGLMLAASSDASSRSKPYSTPARF